MIAVLVGRLFHFFLPGGALLLAGILFSNSGDVIHWRPIVAKALLFVVPAAALLVCWRFNRFKPAFAILVLVLAELLLQNFCRGADIDPALAIMVRDMVGLLIPLNFAWLVLGQEKGLFNVSGLGKLLFIVAQPLLVWSIYLRRPELLTYFSRDFLPWDFPAGIELAQSAIVAYLFALAVLLGNFFRQRGVIDNGFIWALIAGYFGVAVHTGLISTMFLMLGGLVLVVSVVEAAHIMAFRDDLTGLPARRSLNELLLRLRGDYTIAMLDIDFFKKFNDSHGHHVGDQVLKMVAGRIGRVAGGGRAFRYGGEEFTVVFPGKKVGEVAIHLEKVRMAVESAGFSLRDQGRPMMEYGGRKRRGGPRRSESEKIGVTISIGAATNSARTTDPAQVIKKADMALYKAKNGGRNRVIF